MPGLPIRKDCIHNPVCKYEDGMCPMECGYFEESTINVDLYNACKALIKNMNEIPCLCIEPYKKAKRIDPNCPHCNWVYDDEVEKAVMAIAKADCIKKEG